MSYTQKLIKRLLDFDMFAETVQLSYRSKPGYNTWAGTFFTFVCYVIIIGYSFGKINRFYNYEDPDRVFNT